MRVLFWLVLYLLSLGMLDIEVKYSDGLSIQFVGWPKKLGEYFRSESE